METIPHSDRMLYLFLAYLSIWILLGLYLFYIGKKAALLKRELDQLNERIKEKGYMEQKS